MSNEVENTHIEETAVETHEEVVDTHGASTGDESVAASLGLNGQLFAFQLLNFAIVAVIIWFLILHNKLFTHLSIS